MNKTPWKSLKDGYVESLNYMKGRMEGKIFSFKTPWPKFNDAGADGIEWNSTIVIGGRPGTGKTLIKDQIIRESFKRNPTDSFRVLEFQFEMVARTSALREFSSVIGRSYKYMCSASGKMSIEDLQRCYEYAKVRKEMPIDIVDEPCTVSQFKETVHKYMQANMVDGKPMKTIVTLDHSILLKKDAHEGSKMDTIYNLGEAVTELKRKYPIIFIILSQLNREVERIDRQEDGKYGNYILSSDFFGADALLQHADIQIGLNRPANQKIRFYGPDRYIIEDDRVLVLHFLKCRNGDTRMSFFKTHFEKMAMEEMPTPPQQEFKKKNG